MKKKAWEREYEIFSNSKPVVLKEEEQTWDLAATVENLDDFLLKMKWHSNVPGSGAPESVIVGAIQAASNLGLDVSRAEELIDAGFAAYDRNDILTLNKITWRIFYLLNNANKDFKSDYHSYGFYDTWGKIEKEAVFNNYNYDYQNDVYINKLHCAWTAQIVGGALGTAIEGYTAKNLFETFGNITHYVRTPNTYNDDITYELAFLEAFKSKGSGITSADIAEEWAALVPFGWSAEEWAIKNIKSGIYPPRSGYENNPYREWIGAQMRGSICGMVAPGNSREAARLAFIDGVVSHSNNGVLGEIFNAVLSSLAFVKTNIRDVLIESINCIPKNSQYYSVIKFAYDQCELHNDWQRAWQICEEKFKRYNWIHAYPNAAAEVVALYFGDGDFDTTMNIISMAGQDVDCNAAQIAAPIAIINGMPGEKWTAPIGDVLDTYVRSYKKLSINTLSHQTADAARKAYSANKN